MQVSSTPHTFASLRGTCLTLGNFDGLHLGHRKLIGEAIACSTVLELDPLVVTFSPHPRAVLTPGLSILPLADNAQRQLLFQQAGVERLLELNFTSQLASLSAKDFLVEVLAPLNVRHLVVGHDFRMGHNQQPADLEKTLEKLDIGLTRIEPFIVDAAPVSSTRIRDALARGDLLLAALLLGRPYSIQGRVGHGFGRGRKLGFPTANIQTVTTLLPQDGVYATWARTGDKRIPSITNIGHNPTFEGQERTVETFLLDCTGDFYGQPMALEFADRLRGERKFSSPQALTSQISSDVAKARAILAAF